MEHVTPYLKAIIGFIAPGAVILTSAVTESSVGGELITTGEWVTALCATVITGASVFAVPNVPDGSGAHRA